MFESAVLRLTLLYLSLVMLLSVVFSVALFRVSTRELDQSYQHQMKLLETIPAVTIGGKVVDLKALRLEQIQDSKQAIQLDLLFFNVIILALSAGVSYVFAKRTLQPIAVAVEAQNRFTADASHELRTPLTAMKTELEVALRDPKLSLAGSKALHRSNLEELAKLEALSDGLLKLARTHASLDTVEPVLLKEVVQQVIDNRKKITADHQIQLMDTDADAVVDGDRWNLAELTTILLDNAIKYSPANTTVTIGLRRDAHDVYLTVRDEGHGMNASDIPHIFDRFYRADRSRSSVNVAGYGLGLSIAKKIVDLHHGTITVTSEPGKGSCFTVQLPRHFTRRGV